MDCHIGILEVGAPPLSLRSRHGDYVAMFGNLLGPTVRTSRISVLEGQLPEDPLAFDGYLVTGSKLGVNEGHDFIEPLSDFLRVTRGLRPIVGICFGHQLLAQAFGGTVARSQSGWAVGLNSYRMTDAAKCADEDETLSVVASHQDQVIVPPGDAQVIMTSAFTPYAGLSWEGGSIISFQPHPEFSIEYSMDLMRFQNSLGKVPEEVIEAGLKSFTKVPDSARIGRLIRDCLSAHRL